MSLYKTPNLINTTEATILAVDDEKALCDMMAQWITREGISCDKAYCVDDALSLMRQTHYDLVISDLTMPRKSGIEFLNIIRESFPTTAVIIATAVDNRETALLTIEAGAFGYTIKPFSRNEFIINIINALERRRTLLEHEHYESYLEQKVREKTKSIRIREQQIALHLVSASGYRDEETGQHIKRIGLYGAILAKKIGWSQEKIDYMRVAGPMHDVGKIGVPDEVLLKPGKLSPKEFDIIKQHPIIGAKILENSGIPLLEMAHDIALCHHEKWDGTGYPYGLKKEKIPESAQIVALVDVYDALSNNRVYRTALPEEKVVSKMIAANNSHFNPLIFASFLEVLPELREILIEHGDHL